MSILCKLNEIFDKLCIVADSVGDQATLAELCEKIEILEEKLCGPCPVELAAPMTDTNSVALKGDVASQFAAGDSVELLNEAGAVIGTATVVSSLYNAETDQTTVRLSEATVTGELSAVTAVKKTFVAATTITREKVAVKTEAEAEVVAPVRG